MTLHLSLIRTIASCPPMAAAISSVAPSNSAQPASTLPPSSSHAATACTSPPDAASDTSADSPSFTTAGLVVLASGLDPAAPVLVGAALAFVFLPLPVFLAADSFSSASPAGPSAPAAAA